MDFTYEGGGRIQVQGNGSDFEIPHLAYEGDEGVLVGGCSGVEFIIFIRHRFSIGDIVYSLPKAQKGIMRRYTIKEVRVFPFQTDLSRVRRRGYPFAPLYVDTYNAYHNDDELASFSEAFAIAEAAIEAEAIAQEEFIRDLC